MTLPDYGAALSELEDLVAAISANPSCDVDFQRHAAYSSQDSMHRPDDAGYYRYFIRIKPKGTSPRKRIVLFVGLHGVEFYFGDRLIKHCLGMIERLIARRLEVVILYNINPYGALNCIRSSIENIDNNRNGLHMTHADISTPNELYNKNAKLLARLNTYCLDKEFGSLFSVWCRLIPTMVLLLALFKGSAATVVLGGQSLHEHSLFSFSGTKASGDCLFISECFDAILGENGDDCETVIVDIHTGVPSDLIEAITIDDESQRYAESIIGTQKGVKPVRYHALEDLKEGELSSTNEGLYYVGGNIIRGLQRRHPNRRIKGVILEVGVNKPALSVLLAILCSNWLGSRLFTNRSVPEAASTRIKAYIRSIFYPSDKGWEGTQIARISAVLGNMCEEVSEQR